MKKMASKESKRHIDAEQTDTVEEHYAYIMSNEELIDSEFTEVTSNDLPDWYDPELFKRGQQYFQTNKAGTVGCGFMGLALVLTIPSTKKILTFTNRSSTTCSAYKRYLQTVLHIYNIYSSDIDDSNSKFWKSVNLIRWKHSNASRRCLAHKISGIDQQSMALTQFGFMGFIMIEPKLLGLTNEIEYREGFCHVWRVLGHLLGISAKMNICRKNEMETTQLCRLINDRYYKKNLQDYPLEQNPLVNSMIDGCGYIASINRNLFLKHVYEIVGLNYDQPITFYDRLNFNNMLFNLSQTRYFGFIVRHFTNFYMPMILWVVEHYPISAIIKFGVKESQITLYPKIKAH